MKSKESIEKKLKDVSNDYTVRWIRANELDEAEIRGDNVDKFERDTIEKELVAYFLLIGQLKWILADETPEDNLQRT